MTTIDSVESTLASGSSGKKILLLIVGIPVFVILLSTALYFLVDSKSVNLGTVNKGALIAPPLPINDIALNFLDGSSFDYAKPEPKWSFVVFGGKNCVGSCEKMLYLSRQTNTALAKKMNRVRRLYVSYDGNVSDDLQKRLNKDYKNVNVLTTTRESLQELFVNSNASAFQENQFFVVDQRGWIMMHYTAKDIDEKTLSALGKDVLKDMKRLLK